MAVKKLVTPYSGMSTSELKFLRKQLICKANELLKMSNYFEVQMIKDDISVIDEQILLNK